VRKGNVNKTLPITSLPWALVGSGPGFITGTLKKGTCLFDFVGMLVYNCFMNFDKILIAGCSFANGYGLPGEKSNPRIWANQLCNKLSAQTVNNVAKNGANNQTIFLEAMSALIKNTYDLVLVEWSAIPRYNVKAGLELYSVDSMLEHRDINLVGNETIPVAWLSDLKNRLLKLHNDHWDILNLVKYINILIEVQYRTRSGKIFFINGIGPWPDQYFVKKQINLPSDLDTYTYDLLRSDQRDDAEIFQLYEMIHSQYNEYGGIQEHHWLNLYKSQMKTKIDSVSKTDNHPGYQSQDLYAENFYKILKEKLHTQ